AGGRRNLGKERVPRQCSKQEAGPQKNALKCSIPTRFHQRNRADASRWRASVREIHSRPRAPNRRFTGCPPWGMRARVRRKSRSVVHDFETEEPWPSAWTPKGVIEALAPLATEARRDRLRAVIDARLASVTVLMDAPHDPHNGGAVLRS